MAGSHNNSIPIQRINNHSNFPSIKWICSVVSVLALFVITFNYSRGNVFPEGVSKGISSTIRLLSRKVEEKSRPPLYVVGMHHKTGTALTAMVLREAYFVHKEATGKSSGVLMGYFGTAQHEKAPLAFYFCDAVYTDDWNKTDISNTDHLPKLVDHQQFFQGPFRFANLVRDPLELIISAYLYHHGGPPKWQEPWLYEKHPVANYHKELAADSSCAYEEGEEMSWYDVLQCLNESEGLLAEANFQTKLGALPGMVASVQHIYTLPDATILQQGLEDFQNNFDGALRELLEFFDFPPHEISEIVRRSAQHDLKRQSSSDKNKNRHVTTGKFDKSKLRAIMEDFKDPFYLEARRILGYPRTSTGQNRLRSPPI